MTQVRERKLPTTQGKERDEDKKRLLREEVNAKVKEEAPDLEMAAPDTSFSTQGHTCKLNICIRSFILAVLWGGRAGNYDFFYQTFESMMRLWIFT